MASVSMKSLLLGSAAGILATAAAQAADLPIAKAAAVQYVKVCTAYGVGFTEIPGSDGVCIKSFGTVKLHTTYNPSKTAYDPIAGTITEARTADNTGWQSTWRPGWDIRQATEYGTLRTLVQWRIDQREGVMSRVSQRTAPGTAAVGAQAPSMHAAYIEWAGFLLGRTESQFTYFNQADLVATRGGSHKATVQQLTYTWGGRDLKTTLGLEDSFSNQVGPGAITAPNPSINAVGNGPQRMYDVVGSLSSKQAWGDFKVSALAHQISTIATANPAASFPLCSATTSCPTAITTGWAALAGITFLLPQMGDKDQFVLEATFADGAIAAAGIFGGADATPNSFERAGQWSGGLLRTDADAHAVNNGDGSYRLEKERATSVLAQLRHFWTPTLRSNLTLANSWLTPGTTAQNTDVRFGGMGKGRVFDAELNLIWGSRKTAELGVAVMYKKVNQDLPGPTVLPAGIDKDPSVWGFQTLFNKVW
jgi:hypothetical protein